jgi:hypothetical protein
VEEVIVEALTSAVAPLLFLPFPMQLSPDDLPRGTYILRTDDKKWQVGTRVRPLVNRQDTKDMASVGYEKKHLRMVHMYHFSPAFNVDASYIFDDEGHLKDMTVTMRNSEFWTATSQMHWAGLSTAQPYNVQFFDPKHQTEIGEPAHCNCRHSLEIIPVYHTKADLPFADLLPQLEQSNVK